MKCTECNYYYKKEDDKHLRCQWIARAPGEQAPCEEDENEIEEQ